MTGPRTVDTPDRAGSAVYRGLDQAALDREYRARDQVPDFTIYTRRYAEMTAAARASLAVHEGLSYGDSEAETLDLYPAGEGAPLFVYIHGGYWRLLGREDSGFMAPAFVQAGCAVAALNYGLAPAVTLDEIVRQCRAAVAWLWHKADRFGIDRRRIVVGGSSAGGHLAGMLLAPGWHAELGVPEDVVAGGMAASGLFDLEPIRLSEINSWMSLDAETARRNSPLYKVPQGVGTPLVLTVGAHEQGEFKRQTAEFAAAWRAAGNLVHEVPAPDRHHFDVVLDLADPASALFEATMRMTGGGGR
ncbi:Esterase/lipase [Caenispirillum salinarum AK4]|uniref:Esterase/lipase n=1 Tax=Caenispirillum salinarum AK4 TaxID=1238182 RepID=K9HK94_9PROT|nr:alpha/beta hydrolase [Caenispirillum salinarum]EKV30773.1 Esterase/lipase [Caenispirillum salinarum AK4]